MQIYYNVAEAKIWCHSERKEEEIQRPEAVHDLGKSEFGEGSGEREVASLAMGKRKKEEGSSQRGFN